MVTYPSVMWSSGFQKMIYLGPQCQQVGEPGSNPALLTHAATWLVTSGEYAHSYIHSLWIHFIFPLHISEFASKQAHCWCPGVGGEGWASEWLQ